MIDAREKRVRPLIKWTGGKYDEFEFFANYIPSAFRYYVEPFFGGGGVFFAHQPSDRAFLNDKSTDLIHFYSSLSDLEFKRQAFTYADAWDQAGVFIVDLQRSVGFLFVDFLAGNISLSQAGERLKQTIGLYGSDKFYPLFHADFCIDPYRFQAALVDSLVDKFSRIKNISDRNGQSFGNEELRDHFATGVKSGIYLFLRKLMNDDFTGKLKLHKAKRIANWYFVREFCYASMFRYNARGEFNIPYGGLAYNRKNFRQKVTRLFRPDVAALFANAKFTNLDFERFLEKLPLSADDFIFLDPPYDSEFSEYDQNAFTQTDQIRLAHWLFQTRAKWMMVIKETSFIRALYSKPGIRILDFDKNYTYNVRGRNDRSVKHLIILNYGI